MIQLTDTTFDRCEVHIYDIKGIPLKKVPKIMIFFMYGMIYDKQHSCIQNFCFKICKTFN